MLHVDLCKVIRFNSQNKLRRDIEVVITGLTRNQFVPKAHEGSNPSLSARKKHLHRQVLFSTKSADGGINPPAADDIASR